MPSVAVRILHAEALQSAGPLTSGLATTRRDLGRRLESAFRAAGADDVRLISGPPDDTPFGTRLSDLVAPTGPAGLVLAGSGALALARTADLKRLLVAAASDQPAVVANNRFSPDALAVARADYVLRDVPPDLSSDNALPGWIAEHLGITVTDLPRRWRLAYDVDTPLDAILLGAMRPPRGSPVSDRLAGAAAVMRDPKAELLVAGRTSTRTMRWLERNTSCRVRMVVEERGLRAGAASNPRPPASLLGSLLEEAGAVALGPAVERLADAAVIDSRVLLAHRLGADEQAWPSDEDRYASDLLLADTVTDPWLKVLTTSAAGAEVPIVLGAHTLVGPGVRLVARWR